MLKHSQIFQFNINPCFKNLEVCTLSCNNTKIRYLECLTKLFHVNSTLIDQFFFSFIILLLPLVFFLNFVLKYLWFSFSECFYSLKEFPIISPLSPYNDRGYKLFFTKKISSGSCVCYFYLTTVFTSLFFVFRFPIFQVWCFPPKLFLKFGPTPFFLYNFNPFFCLTKKVRDFTL